MEKHSMMTEKTLQLKFNFFCRVYDLYFFSFLSIKNRNINKKQEFVCIYNISLTIVEMHYKYNILLEDIVLRSHMKDYHRSILLIHLMSICPHRFHTTIIRIISFFTQGKESGCFDILNDYTDSLQITCHHVMHVLQVMRNDHQHK